MLLSWLEEIKKLKNKALFYGWIIGLLILTSLFWILTQQPQTFNLMRTVNNVLIHNNDSRRVAAHTQVKTANAGILGYWYLMYNSPDKMFVFTLFHDGILLPLGAIVSPNGTVNDVIPLSAHAAQVFDDIPESIFKTYIKRIEDTASGVTEGARR